MEEKLKNISNQAEAKHKKQADEHNKKIKSLQQRVMNWIEYCKTPTVLFTKMRVNHMCSIIIHMWISLVYMQIHVFRMWWSHVMFPCRLKNWRQQQLKK
jgi:hypothetical protein